jgi:polyhydroxyalkanoate synthase
MVGTKGDGVKGGGARRAHPAANSRGAATRRKPRGQAAKALADPVKRAALPDRPAAPAKAIKSTRRARRVPPPAPEPEAKARPETEARGATAPDPATLAANLGRFADETNRIAGTYVQAKLAGDASSLADTEMAQMARTLGQVAQSWLAEPERSGEAQARLTGRLIDLWGDALLRFKGEEMPAPGPGDARDPRFKDPAWHDNPFFDFLRRSHGHVARWAEDMVNEAPGIDAHTRHKARFYVRQLAAALSPSNFPALNPEIIRETIHESAANLARGARMLAEDVEAGKGELKLRQTDATNFEVGVNLATTPGKVVFRDELIELIQYAPTTETVLKRPLLIVPPWINKFYILDLTPEKSFIRWCVEQGLTVFVVSWVNPDGRHAEKGFSSYMREGILAALDAVAAATGEREVTAIGYCVGGTLLAATLGYMATMGDRRVTSATFFTTQVDFTHAGDLQVFVDEEQVQAVEADMAKRGYLDGARMASAFNMLRPNDLIWRYVVDVYLKGRPPAPFDLLYWNSDSTRMTAANHSFYLRNCYLDNKLSRGEMALDGVKIDLSKVTIPIYNLAAREDHIAPALSAFEGSRCFGGEVRYVMAGSGHIAGVVNPPARRKYQYWTGGPPKGSFADWVASATEHKGSWWPDWFAWIEAQAPERVPARQPGDGALRPLCDAPGTYVKVKA